MKKSILFLLFLVLNVYSYSENFSLIGKYIPNLYTTVDDFYIRADTVSLIYEIDIEEKIIKYQKNYKNGVMFFELSENFPKNFSEDYQYHGKVIETKNDLLILAGKEVDSGRILLFATTLGFDKEDPFIYPIFHFSETSYREYTDCSSCLKEKNKEYPVENLNKFIVDTPWVEAVPGDGIGEGFTLVNSWGKVYPYILLMNGYISYEKPYLYKQNNRIKKIKVTGLTSGKSKVLDVLDTPHPQTVDISFITIAEDIRVEIADVYKGTKYDDTCLHYCITYDAQVIPYENSIVE